MCAAEEQAVHKTYLFLALLGLVCRPMEVDYAIHSSVYHSMCSTMELLLHPELAGCKFR